MPIPTSAIGPSAQIPVPTAPVTPAPKVAALDPDAEKAVAPAPTAPIAIAPTAGETEVLTLSTGRRS